MDKQATTDLREHLATVIQKRWATVFEDEGRIDPPMALADAVLAVIAERERLLRERILAAIDASDDYYINQYVNDEIHRIVLGVFDDES